MAEAPPIGGDAITVGQLADRLGVEDHEAFALCVASRIAVRDITSVVSPADVARLDDVLAGRVALKPQRRRPRLPFNPVKAVIVTCVLVLLTAGAVAVVRFQNREVNLEVAPGDCFDSPGVLGAELEPIPCRDDHDFRAFATVDLISLFPEFPGDGEMQRFAMERCRDLAGRAEVGTGTYAAFWPRTERSWRSLAARHLVCATPTDSFGGVLPFATP